MAMDPVNKKAVKKDFDDRKDQDIDNDGDVDSSDEYLHKRRKAVSKAVKNVKESIELGEAPGAKDVADDHGLDRGTRVSKKAWDRLKKSKKNND